MLGLLWRGKPQFKKNISHRREAFQIRIRNLAKPESHEMVLNQLKVPSLIDLWSHFPAVQSKFHCTAASVVVAKSDYRRVMKAGPVTERLYHRFSVSKVWRCRYHLKTERPSSGGRVRIR